MLFGKKKRTIDTGTLGERFALAYLRDQGYEILEKNYRRRFGEIDIIARDRGIIVFVEVKTRHSECYGSPAEAVGREKQSRLARVAQDYLQSHRLLDAPARFDVCALLLDRDNRPERIELIKDAFDCSGADFL